MVVSNVCVMHTQPIGPFDFWLLLYWFRFIFLESLYILSVPAHFLTLFFFIGWKQILAHYLFHHKLSRKINPMKCLIEAGPAKFNIHAASVWLLLRNQEVLILTALRHPPFKGRDGKMNLRQERGVIEQLLLEFLGSLPMHTILPRLLPPDLSRQSCILKNEWQDKNMSKSNLIETFFQVQSGCRVCCQGNCSVLLTYCNVQKVFHSNGCVMCVSAVRKGK